MKLKIRSGFKLLDSCLSLIRKRYFSGGIIPAAKNITKTDQIGSAVVSRGNFLTITKASLVLTGGALLVGGVSKAEATTRTDSLYQVAMKGTEQEKIEARTELGRLAGDRSGQTASQERQDAIWQVGVLQNPNGIKLEQPLPGELALMIDIAYNDTDPAVKGQAMKFLGMFLLTTESWEAGDTIVASLNQTVDLNRRKWAARASFMARYTNLFSGGHAPTAGFDYEGMVSGLLKAIDVNGEPLTEPLFYRVAIAALLSIANSEHTEVINTLESIALNPPPQANADAIAEINSGLEQVKSRAKPNFPTRPQPIIDEITDWSVDGLITVVDGAFKDEPTHTVAIAKKAIDTLTKSTLSAADLQKAEVSVWSAYVKAADKYPSEGEEIMLRCLDFFTKHNSIEELLTAAGRLTDPDALRVKAIQGITLSPEGENSEYETNITGILKQENSNPDVVLIAAINKLGEFAKTRATYDYLVDMRTWVPETVKAAIDAALDLISPRLPPLDEITDWSVDGLITVIDGAFGDTTTYYTIAAAKKAIDTLAKSTLSAADLQKAEVSIWNAYIKAESKYPSDKDAIMSLCLDFFIKHNCVEKLFSVAARLTDPASLRVKAINGINLTPDDSAALTYETKITGLLKPENNNPDTVLIAFVNKLGQFAKTKVTFDHLTGMKAWQGISPKVISAIDASLALIGQRLQQVNIKQLPGKKVFSVLFLQNRINLINAKKGMEYRIYNAEGQVVQHGAVQKDLITVDLLRRSPGMYILKLKHGPDSFKTFKFMKVNR